MFGYVIADFTRLSTNGKKRYRQYYCGLCHALRLKYGARARWLLNYDTTFLLILLLSLENNICLNTCRCPYHFFKKRQCATGDITEYAADVTVLLSYLKFIDDIKDDNSLKAKLLSKIYKPCFEKANRDHPDLTTKIQTHLDRLLSVEKANEHNPQIPASIFGNLLGDVFGDTAYDVGYALGRFIYLSDAACDFKSDLKHSRYNPLVRCRKDEVLGLLLIESDKCISAVSSLDIKRDKDIIENILHNGIWLKYNLKHCKGNKK